MKKLLLLPLILLLSTSLLFAQLSLDSGTLIKNSPNIYGLIVAKNDKVIYSKYFNKFSNVHLFNDQSLTKNLCSILIGIAIDKGFIESVDERLVDFFPELKNDPDKRKQEITIRQIMNQASGLYHENLEQLGDYLSLPNPSVYVLRAPMVSNPGKEWHYNNAASHLLSVIITKSTRMDTQTFAVKYLFEPLGIIYFNWAKMNDDYYDGCGLLAINMRPTDWLKIAQTLMHDGMYNGTQVIAAKWVKEIFWPHVSYKATWGFPESTYGLCFYHLNYQGVKVTYGMGWGGQFLVLIPEKQAVIIINQSPANAVAIKQSNYFINKIFPSIFEQIK
jgi:CubicO group peptidase (beta-lactamase class C family)